ncbi:RNA polymerase sigma factor [Actinomadura welshii]|uniref:RNA polymerase sigma factor n=1 Tax=Actinomadura welshii TaxID=3103817 RepID=UPI0004668E64|nr:RNA polymerase sigma factor [Actinomadura madurae]
MRGDLDSLYDAHADRLYAYCWSLVGDRHAAAAVADTFSAAVHQPPRGDSVLWLYSLARTTCAERAAFTGELGGPTVDGRGGPLFAGSDPLLRAAAALRSDHREVLLLWAGEWLEPHDIARVLGVAPDTVAQLLNAARTRLERAVLDILMRGTAQPRLDLITAFEKGRLPRLLAGTAPSRAPRWLRAQVLAACEAEATRPLPSVSAPSPLVVIGPRAEDRPKRGLSAGVSKGFGAAAGVAASAAAVIGLLVSWPAAKGGGASSLVPTASKGQTQPASTQTHGVPQSPLPGLPGSVTPESGPKNPVAGAYESPPQEAGGAPGGGTAAAPPATSPPPARERPPASTTPSKPQPPTTPPDETPTTPPDSPSDPTTPPPDDGSADPTTPPPSGTPTDPPPGDPGTPSPSPTSNPAPQPGQG